MLKEKAVKMKKLIKQLYLPKHEMYTCWMTIVLPTIKYGLSATIINSKKMIELQQPLTHEILPKIGYNRHTPRALVYASTTRGGIGLQNMDSEQGIAKVQFIIGGMLSNNDITENIRALIESYMIASGITKNPFEDNRILSYISSPWINSVKSFLNKINGKIVIKNIRRIQANCTNDEPIMEKVMRHTSNKTHLEAINNCRVYLQLILMSELIDFGGTYINNTVYHGTIDTTGNIMNKKFTRSLLMWPAQTRPPIKAWRIWQKWIKTLMVKNTITLKRALTGWKLQTTNSRLWFNNTGKIINTLYPDRQDTTIKRPYRTNQLDKEMANRFQKMERIYIEYSSSIEGTTYHLKWSIWEKKENKHRMSATHNEGIIGGKEKGDLLAILHALTFILECLKFYYSVSAPKNITINPPNRTAENYLNTIKFKRLTIYELTKNEGELKEIIRNKLKHFPEYNVSETTTPHRNTGKESNIEDTGEIKAYKMKVESQVHLLINNLPITNNIQESMRKESTNEEYDKYLGEKYNWTPKCIESINGEAIKIAITNQRTYKKRFISKLMHGWIPTKAHPGFSDEECPDKTCPMCYRSNETNKHFQICKEYNSESAVNLIKNINAINPKTQVQNYMSYVIQQAIEGKEIFLPDIMEKINTGQERIGWNQLLLGRISIEWEKTYNRQTNTTNGQKWTSEIIRQLWKYHETRWNERCNKIHSEDETTNKKNNEIMDNEIQTLYSQKDKLDEVDRKLLSQPISKRLKMDIKAKSAWLKCAKKEVLKGIKTNKEKIRKENRSIQKYFTIEKEKTKERGIQVTRIRAQHQETSKPREITQSKKRSENWKVP
jgi:hypothetical protein